MKVAAAELAKWQRSPLGKALLEAESHLLEAALADVFGLELLQVGPWAVGGELLAGARTRHSTVVAAHPGGGGSGASATAVSLARAHPAHLPIATASVDAVLLAHCLEVEPDPQAVLREVDRVLVGEGHLLILGLRPMSAWGLRAAASRSGFPPGFARLLPEGRVRDWLALLGYEAGAARHYLYTLPRAGAASARGLLRRGLFNPLPAGAYLIKARKRIYGVSPPKPLRWRERPAFAGTLTT